jgi:hypothetical protein
MKVEMNASEPWLLLTGAGLCVLPAGRWWDAVRVDADRAQNALLWLGDCSGAVIIDPRAHAWYWLTPVASADWDEPHTRALSHGSWVGVPPHYRVHGPGVHWHVPPAAGRCLTSAALLRRALRAAR